MLYREERNQPKGYKQEAYDFAMYTADELTVTADTAFGEAPLFDGSYSMAFEMWDAQATTPAPMPPPLTAPMARSGPRSMRTK